MNVSIDGNTLGIEDIVVVARHNAKAVVDQGARGRMGASRAVIEELVAQGAKVYGVTTGVGAMSTKTIPTAGEYQHQLIRAHAAGVGGPLSKDVVRAMMLLRANSLAKGLSGVRPIVVDTLVEMLNRGVCPIVPQKGSVGASGDLIPLAHISLVMIGEGEACVNGARMRGKEAMDLAGITPLRLKTKEGIALINGTQLMSAIGALGAYDCDILLKSAEVASAMSLESLMGTDRALDERIHRAKGHPGQIRCAKEMRDLVKGSELIASHRECPKIQDAYTLRCIPQVLGAARDALQFVCEVTEREANAASDNPLIFDHDVLSGGNFHGQHMAFVLDLLGIVLADVGCFSERRIAQLMDAPHLPPFLSQSPGNPGLMLTQYAAASLASENKILAHPASVDTIPTSNGVEDHVSMGSIAGLKLLQILENTQNIVGIELLCASRALDLVGLNPGEGTAKARKIIGSPQGLLSYQIEQMAGLVRSGDLAELVS